jgi:hypothetical protein
MKAIRTEPPKQSCTDGVLATFAQKEGHRHYGDRVKNIEIINGKNDREENSVGWMFDGFEISTLILVGSAAMLSLLPDPDPDQIRFAVETALGGTLMLGGAGAGRLVASWLTMSAAKE